mgnify:CR=1 FL=1|tara:strand:- start:984 stop:1967 length:984 start_codon:yes stop_codon:yes gene_type:complete
MSGELDRLLELGDLDGLIRLIDQCCVDESWVLLESIAIRSRQANERGHQLWPAGDHAEHRLALESPGEFAARAVSRDAQIFGLAPLTEVAASSHTWGELDPYLTASPARAVIAHERVFRGENLSDIELEEDPLSLPLALAEWEHSIKGSEIKKYEIVDIAPSLEGLTPLSLPSSREIMHDSATKALRNLVHIWTEQSNGSSTAVRVDGDAKVAIASLGIEEVKGRQVSTSEMWTYMTWAASSGGAFGRRPGCAKGRFEVWWCATALAGLDQEDTWPPDVSDLEEALNEMNWWIWDDEPLSKGWRLKIAIEDPIEGLSWALNAQDQTN